MNQPPEPRETDFSERMAMSQGVASNADIQGILLQEIPGALAVYPAHPTNDRRGVDWWIEMASGTHLAVDAKVRERDWAATHPDEDDLALETWSVMESQVPGWTRDASKRCDYVLWLWKDTGRFCLLPFPLLCRAFSEQWEAWRDQYRVSRQRTAWATGDYRSECIFVPRQEVWRAIYQRIGGSQQSTIKPRQ